MYFTTNHVLVLIFETLPKVLPLFVMRTFGWSSSGSGLIFIAVILPSVFGPLIGLCPVHNLSLHISLNNTVY